MWKQRAVAVLSISALWAVDLSEGDRKDGLAHLERTRVQLIEATKGLSDAQWKFKPAPDRWSVAEALEHIVLTEDMLFEMVSKKVMQAPAGKPDRDYRKGDALVLRAIPDRTTRVKAPEALLPASRRSPAESLEDFLESRKRTVEFLKTTPGLRDHVVDSPLGAPLDGYQWLLYISAHSERHTKQILEVKADPGFPKQ